MKLELNVWLRDIKVSIEEINEFIPVNRNYNLFKNDKKTKKAVERNIEIIGEALSRILKQDPEINISDSRKIVDARNRIIHGYDSVSTDVLWLIINNYLPVLEKEVEDLLNK